GGLGVVRDALRSVDDPPADGAPFSVLAEAARLQFSARLFNLSVGSASGPSEPLELLGRQVVDLFGLPFLPAEHGFAASVITYDGRVEYGLLGDYDALGDLGVVAAGIDQTLGELLAAAAAVEAVRETRRRQDSAPPAAEVPELEPIAEGGLMSSTVRRHGGPASDMRAKRRRS
ncbi:MAG: DUF1298 domain-containing protein, partial [Solirubrobacterales bacterium]|nr:DUF1298 domain-containing protein [Solirubrobacterales bacterium]